MTLAIAAIGTIVYHIHSVILHVDLEPKPVHGRRVVKQGIVPNIWNIVAKNIKHKITIFPEVQDHNLISVSR
jgi:hypothetical protein